MFSTREVSSNPAASQLSNTSSVDVFSTSEFANGEGRNHQEFWNNVVPNAMSATMEPGDMLFLPPGWWHGMRSEDSSISVSMWF
jgi:Cupin-like domain